MTVGKLTLAYQFIRSPSFNGLWNYSMNDTKETEDQRRSRIASKEDLRCKECHHKVCLYFCSKRVKRKLSHPLTVSVL